MASLKRSSSKRAPRALLGPQARGRIAAACLQVVTGKHAARELAAWIAGSGVSEAEFRLLWLLFDLMSARADAELDQARLAERLAASPALVSGAVERLRILGLIDVRLPASDRRCQQWRLTPAGGQLVLRVVAAVDALPPREGARRDAA